MKTVNSLAFYVRQAFRNILKEYPVEINREITDTNIVRIQIISGMLIATNLLLIIIYSTIYFRQWEINSSHMNTFYSYMFLTVERSLYLLVTYIMKRRNLNHLYKFKGQLVIYSCVIVLAWCSFHSINAQYINGQIAAFIIGCFAVASAILLKPKHSLMLFVGFTGLFTVMLYFHAYDSTNLINNTVNAIFVASFSCLMSSINFTLFSRDCANKNTIQNQSRELEHSRSKLEEIVKERTDDLIRANEQLIKEIGIRHEIELQSIRTRLMYEENERLLNEIKEYEELRNVFFANLSHELRTPLNVIFSAQQMMNFIISKQACETCSGKLDKYNNIVRQNCYRLIRLIGNLIDITKIDARYFELEKKNCDIVKVVESITLSVAEYIKDKNIGLSFQTNIKEKVIACDPDKIERILLNLFSNAVKFTPEHGAIHVKMYTNPGYICISVKDTGIGIGREMQEVIFERFIQADKSTTRNREGSGIGLSLVKSLVDLHLGRIFLYSEPGKGSEFVIELPDLSIPFEDCVACTSDSDDKNIERISIEFSDIYS